MAIVYFLDLPVYRLSRERYQAECVEYAEKIIYTGTPAQREVLNRYYAENPEQESSFRDCVQQLYGGAWEYNEVIGQIQLHFLGSQVRGEYWQMKGKRIQRTRRKTFEWQTWKLVPEMHIPDSATNAEILTIVRQYVSACGKELKHRYIDSRRLEAIGPYVNWRKLMCDAQPLSQPDQLATEADSAVCVRSSEPDNPSPQA